MGAALRQTQRHLKWLQIEHEHNLETLQRVRRQRARLRDQVNALSDALAASLSQRFWEGRPARSGVGRLLGRAGSSDPEADLVAEVESCNLFDGGWYLRTYPKVLQSGVSPALHYVRAGSQKGLDPGPGFSTSAYMARHPEASNSGLPALVHAARHGNLHERTPDDGQAESLGSDVHL